MTAKDQAGAGSRQISGQRVDLVRLDGGAGGQGQALAHNLMPVGYGQEVDIFGPSGFGEPGFFGGIHHTGLLFLMALLKSVALRACRPKAVQ